MSATGSETSPETRGLLLSLPVKARRWPFLLTLNFFREIVSNSDGEQFFRLKRERARKNHFNNFSPFYPNVNNKSESPPNCRRALKFSTLKNFIKIFLFEQRLIKSSQVKKSLSGGKRKNLPPIKVFLQFLFPHHNQLEKANKSETHRVLWNPNSIQ